MGTFHDDKGELHGITVVVDTKGAMVYIGRCDEIDDRQIVLLDVDEHEDGQGNRSKEDFIKDAARVGVWGRIKRVALPLRLVASVTPLGKISVD